LNWLRTAAWTVFGGPTGQALLRGFTLMLASGLAGIAVVLIFSSWKRNIIGLWVSLVCAAIPLLWVGAGMLGVFE